MLETITIEGLPPHVSISMTMSAEQAVRTATLDLAFTGKSLPCLPGDKTRVLAGGDLVLTGYVRDVNASHDMTSRTLGVSLVSRTVDATECSVIHPTGECMDKDLATIAREFDGLGIGIEDDGDLPKEPRHKLATGESLFHSIERRARGRGILIYDTPEGKLKLATKPQGTHAGGLIFGRNILAASSSLSEKGRHSSVKVRGQKTEGTGKGHLRSQSIARDDSVVRDRPLIILHEGEAEPDRMRKRAEWQVKRGAGNSVTAQIKVTGWRDDKGKIWSPNYLVHVEDDMIGINGLMIIKSVTLAQGPDGTTAALSLADPRALGGENPRGKTAKAYTAPGAIETELEDE